jgi:hypothetical protein
MQDRIIALLNRKQEIDNEWMLILGGLLSVAT